MRAQLNRGTPPGCQSTALGDRWKFCGCVGDDNDGNGLALCAVAPPMVSSTSLEDMLPLLHLISKVSNKGFFVLDHPLRSEFELLCLSTTSRGACASARFLRTPFLRDISENASSHGTDTRCEAQDTDTSATVGSNLKQFGCVRLPHVALVTRCVFCLSLGVSNSQLRITFPSAGVCRRPPYVATSVVAPSLYRLDPHVQV